MLGTMRARTRLRPPRRLGVMIPVLILAACSRVAIVYDSADFLAKGYASAYLGLADDQISRWEPRLKQGLARHRAEELPQLAAFFDQTLKASRTGFDANNMSCLTGDFRTLYRRHAQLAVDLTAPLLADLTATQIDALERKFRAEAREDQEDLAKRNIAWEKTKRARRYVKAIEDWTGALRSDQRAIVADVTGRIPETEAAVVAYREFKRRQLIALLKRGAGDSALRAFMTAWLVDFTDLPPALTNAGDAIEARVGELFIRLGASFDAHQRDHFERRLRRLRDDLLKLQQQPRMAPLPCTQGYRPSG